MVPFLSHLSHSVLCLNHFANHQHHHGSYQQVLRQNCPMDSHLTSDIRSGLKSSFKNKSNVAGTCRALPCLAQSTDLKNSVRCLSLVQKLILLGGTLCITVLTNTETIISSNMICISAVHIIFIIVQSTVSKTDTFGTGTSCPS